eukprot:5248162-Prymnesium_polylepis.1
MGFGELWSDKILRLLHSPYWVKNRLASGSIGVRVDTRTIDDRRSIKDIRIKPGQKKALPQAWSGRSAHERRDGGGRGRRTGNTHEGESTLIQ